MRSWFRNLDELLRGRRTSPDALLNGVIELPLRRFVPISILLGAVYGFFMGWYAILSREPAEYQQLLATVVKIPALFILTLVVTFPSLYVFNALVGCRLDFKATLRLLVGSIAVNLAVAASLGTILAFFTLTTKSYSFMIVLNVILMGIGGVVGLGFLLQTLRRLAVLDVPVEPLPAEDTAVKKADQPNTSEGTDATVPDREPGMLDAAYRDYPPQSVGRGNLIFKIWVAIYSLVGAQMGWLLRPFIGNPDQPFEWFRNREGNFFTGLFTHLRNLLESGG